MVSMTLPKSKLVWSHSEHFGLVQTQFNHDQNICCCPKQFGQVQNPFGPIEGQGIDFVICFADNFDQQPQVVPP